MASFSDRVFIALAQFNGRLTSFTDLAFDANSTFLFPITDHGSDVSAIMDATMDSIFLGQKKAADALKDANTKVHALFK